MTNPTRRARDKERTKRSTTREDRWTKRTSRTRSLRTSNGMNREGRNRRARIKGMRSSGHITCKRHGL